MLPTHVYLQEEISSNVLLSTICFCFLHLPVFSKNYLLDIPYFISPFLSIPSFLKKIVILVLFTLHVKFQMLQYLTVNTCYLQSV
jgi:hypothetical protein